MSDLIKLLPDNIANQIAAGEVIQRPASVVKELMENAIDAGATRIDVNIKDSGKTLIQIVDNGSGMTKSDARLCFERHATSKVSKAEDLFHLTTKGFRGEALASIAAIAHVSLKTKRKELDTGTLVDIEGSTIRKCEDTVCPNGTSFEVKNLFYNVPARRNFLKSDKVEFNHISDEFIRVALAHPDISFTLKHNGNELYNLPDSVLRKRVVETLGKKFNDRLVPIEETTDIVELNGFVLKPEFAKRTRGEQFLFVNDRFFKSSYFNHAINQAFDGLLKEKTFPSYYLYLKVDPQKIDVNVHPTKTEIKFEEEKFIYSILLSAVRQALGKYNIAPSLDFERETSFDIPHDMRSQPTVEPTIKVDTTFNPFQSKGSSSSVKKDHSSAIRSQGFGVEIPKKEDWDNFYQIEEDTNAHSKTTLIDEESIEKTKSYVVKNNLLMTPSKSGFLLIHTKRALERIVYDQIHNAFVSSPIESQKLLFPIEFETSKSDVIAWTENQSILKQLGFDGDVKKEVLEVSAVPAVIQEERLSTTIEEMLSILQHQDIEKGDLAHKLIESIAAGAAQKQLDLSTPESVDALIDQLFQCENHMYSPRNKKIIESLTSEELMKKLD